MATIPLTDPIAISAQLCREVERLAFAPPVEFVYNPLAYARGPHEEYLRRYAIAPKEILLLGMNPGPFGMAQTGVPFGDKTMVRGWLGIEGAVGKPAKENPKRLVEGFACPRGEVSGTRLWGWARERYGAPEKFFERFFVWNFCPLAFMEAGCKNRTPDKLPAGEREPLFAACGQALAAMVEALGRPKYLIGVGKFAEDQIRAAMGEGGECGGSEGGEGGEGGRFIIGSIPHPSPANPAANRGWAPLAEAALVRLGVEL